MSMTSADDRRHPLQLSMWHLVKVVFACAVVMAVISPMWHLDPWGRISGSGVSTQGAVLGLFILGLVRSLHGWPRSMAPAMTGGR